MTHSAFNPFDPNLWKRDLLPASPVYGFNVSTAEEARNWQQNLRAKFQQRLGRFPDEKSPLNPVILQVDEFPGYRREALRFTSRAGLEVFACFLFPAVAQGPLPTLLCLPGHGYGVNSIIGLDAQGEPLKEPFYDRAFALQAVERGYAVLALELLGFGQRREGLPASPEETSCQTLAGTALMLGQTLAGWRVYDAMRALDYLCTRPEVDEKRLGAMGISGGGTNTLFLSALDERVRATVVSGYLNTFRDSVMSISHCIDNFVPGLGLDAEMSDLAGLIAPRALWCEHGNIDHIFPVAAFEQALKNTKKIYAVLEAEARCDGEVFEGGHQFHGVGAWAFLEEQLRG